MANYMIDEKKNLVPFSGSGSSGGLIKKSLTINGLTTPGESITISNGIEFINSLQNVVMATLATSFKVYNSIACTVITEMGMNVAMFEFAHTNSNNDLIQINIAMNDNAVIYNSDDYDTPIMESPMTLNVYLEP